MAGNAVNCNRASLLLAVQARAVSNPVMTMTALLALTLAPASPLPLTDIQQRDLGCVAILGLMAQERNIPSKQASAQYPNLFEHGKLWTGKVGVRIMEESGQPREVVALAIQEAVDAVQTQAGRTANPHGFIADKLAACVVEMDRQLAAPVATPAPVIATTDDLDTIARYRTQLDEDLADPQHIRFCAGLITTSRLEIIGREGSDSPDAIALGRLAQALEMRRTTVPKAVSSKAVSVDALFDSIKTEPDRDAQMARCLRLGESLALALPPE